MITENLHCNYVIQLKANQTNLNKMIKSELGNADTWIVEDSAIAAKANSDKAKNTIDPVLISEQASTSNDTYELFEKNHGRHSFWKTSVYNVSCLQDPKKILSSWKSINTIICVQRIVTHTHPKNKKKDYNSRAYYISNRTDLTAKEFHVGIRGHWSIENGLHYEKDVVLNEDKNRIQDKSAAVVISTFNSFVINFLRMIGFDGIKDAAIKFGFNFKELVF